MQFLSFIPRYFARRKAVSEQDARLYKQMIHKGGCVLAELQGMREDARAHAKEVLEGMEWFRAQMKSWYGNGMPATREEFDLLEEPRLERPYVTKMRAERASMGDQSSVGLSDDAKDVWTDAPVFDSDNDLQIMGILGVNAKAGWVLVADLPVQLMEHGHIKSRRLRFKKIVQFDPNDQSSGSFHCYGRLPDSKEGV